MPDMGKRTVSTAKHPIFDKYTLEELHERTGHKVTYLAWIKEGYKEPGPQFRRLFSHVLNEPEDALFGAQE